MRLQGFCIKYVDRISELFILKWAPKLKVSVKNVETSARLRVLQLLERPTQLTDLLTGSPRGGSKLALLWTRNFVKYLTEGKVSVQ